MAQLIFDGLAVKKLNFVMEGSVVYMADAWAKRVEKCMIRWMLPDCVKELLGELPFKEKRNWKEYEDEEEYIEYD